MIPMDGISIIFSPYVGTYKEKTVDRTWIERLFKIPWKPLASTKTISGFEPGIYIVDIPSTVAYGGVYLPKQKLVLAHISFESAIKEFGWEKVNKSYAK